jgi:hypothetical protein
MISRAKWIFLIGFWCAAAMAEDDSGLRMQPRWSSDGALTVHLSNWSKVPISLSAVEARLGEGGHRECLWRGSDAASIGPTEARTVTLASATAVRSCLNKVPGLKGLVLARSRFSVATQANTPQAEVRLAAISIEVKVQQFKRRHSARSSFDLLRSEGGQP